MRSRSRLLFERSAARGILRAVEEEAADVVVMARSGKRSLIPGDVSPTMREVLRRTPCEVLIDQPSGAQVLAAGARAPTSVPMPLMDATKARGAVPE
jgi:hypothetical protein